jgi:hypothetical protein
MALGNEVSITTLGAVIADLNDYLKTNNSSTGV